MHQLDDSILLTDFLFFGWGEIYEFPEFHPAATKKQNQNK